MAAVIDPSDRAFLASQIRGLRAWADRAAGQLTIALAYGGVSEEDQFYIAKSPPEQLSVTALSAALTELRMRFTVLDPCRPEFIAALAGFDVACPTCTDRSARTAACKGCWTTCAPPAAAAAWPPRRSPRTRSCASR